MQSCVPADLCEFAEAPAAPVAGADDLLRKLGGSLAHHVNNALAGVIGYLELALRSTPPDSPVHRYLQASLECAQRAAQTVWRIASFTQQPVSEAQVPRSLAQVARESAQRLRQRGVRVEVEAECEARVWASPALLALAWQAVLDNAVEAMPRESVLLLRVISQPGSHAIQVRDAGPGLSPEARAHLFEPFWTTTPAGHLGLGLAMAREMMLAQKGSLEVDSLPGQGTTATLGLPAVADPHSLDLRAPHHPVLAAPHLTAFCSP